MSLLKNITKGKIMTPICIMVYGVHGIGKSTFPSKAPNPIYVGPEENDELNVARFPKITCWTDLKNQLKTLRDEKHDFKTVVVDAVDTLEQFAVKEILKKEPTKTMATALGGYGAAYRKMQEMFVEIRDEYLVPIRHNKKMNIVLIAHAEKTKHEDPLTQTSYDTFSISSHNRVKCVFEDWVSAILFCTFELFRKERADGREYAIGDGERIIYTEERPSHIAKNRFNLSYEMPLDWNEFIKEVKLFYSDAKKATKETKKIEEKISKSESNSKSESEPKNKPEEGQGESSNGRILELMKEVDEIFEKMPEDVKSRIATSIKRAKGKEKELERIANKMRKILE